jgi:hypothetical protein
MKGQAILPHATAKIQKGTPPIRRAEGWIPEKLGAIEDVRPFVRRNGRHGPEEPTRKYLVSFR